MSIVIFILSLSLGTCAFCGFIGFVRFAKSYFDQITNSHFFLEASQWISSFLIAFYSIYLLVLVVDVLFVTLVSSTARQHCRSIHTELGGLSKPL